MIDKSCGTWWARIYIAGPIAVAEQVCRQECLRQGLCVTVDPTKFIYKGGEENGVVVGLIAYPKFPTPDHLVTARAVGLAIELRRAMCQESVLIMDPITTRWLSDREGA